MKNIFAIPMIVGLVGLSLNFGASVQESNQNKQAAVAPKIAGETKEEASDGDFVPVDNMHHFMEYICEPSYKQLKSMLVEEPANRKAWKAFKNHALVLAETSALVAERGPKEADKSKQWKQLSLAVHKHGTAMYKSSGKFEDAKKHYGLMIDQCNKCHTVFAEGKYQLAK